MFRKLISANWGDLDLDLIQTDHGYQCRYGLEVHPLQSCLLEAVNDFIRCRIHGTEANGEPDK